MTFVIRASSDPLALARAVPDAVWEVDHDQPMIRCERWKTSSSGSLWHQHFLTSMLSIFAAIALLIAALGIYGVISYTVNQRTHEIGIRSALGSHAE